MNRVRARVQIFERHGQVEEVFIMRGGSRSGMACAFVRFRTREMAQQAIDAIHGQARFPSRDLAPPRAMRWQLGRSARARRAGDGAAR